MLNLAARSEKEELLDQPGIQTEDLFRNLYELELINARLGGHHATLEGVRTLLRGKQGKISVLDVGCGGGDVFRPLLKLGQEQGVSFDLKGIDHLPEAVEYARDRTEGDPHVHFEVQDLKELETSGEQYDIVICSLVCHHLYGEELQKCIRGMEAVSRIGVVINDIHRHWLAWGGIALLTRLFSRSYLVRHDAALSVRKAFRKEEWEALLKEAGVEWFRIRWYWVFRHQILIDKRKYG